jgi:hypothetical protein
VQRTLEQLGRDIHSISHDDIELFVKHAGFLKVIRYRSLEEEYTSPKTKFLGTHTFAASPNILLIFIFLDNEFENTFPPTLIHYYFALRAYDKFVSLNGRPPGVSDHTVVDDGEKLLQLMKSELCGTTPATRETLRNACSEM